MFRGGGPPPLLCFPSPERSRRLHKRKGISMMLTIGTPRLTLRLFEEADAQRIAYLAGDYDVARMCGRVPHPYPIAAAYSWIGRQDDNRKQGGEFAFAVIA